MFEEEKQEWTHLFDVYKKVFNENIGIMPGIYESEPASWEGFLEYFQNAVDRMP